MTLIAIGGKENKDGAMTVLRRVLAEAKGAASRVHVITTATGYPDEIAQVYRDAFARLGVACEVSHISTRAMADDPLLARQLAGADVIFFSGGDQSKLARILNGTAVLKAVRECHSAGAVVAGTSAGAAAMSALMVAGGDPERAMVKGEVVTEQGFGLAPDIVFDTHFMNRGRLKRLFSITAAAPDKTGIGLDEDTGVILRANGEMEVIGSGDVTLVDARELTCNNSSEARTGDNIHAEGFRVTTLKPGDVFRMG